MGKELDKLKLLKWLENKKEDWENRLQHCFDDLEALSIVYICKQLENQIKQGKFDKKKRR